MSKKDDLIKQLINIGAFKLGEFVLKSGSISPIYIDLRTIISHPDIVELLVEELHFKQADEHLSFDVVCGVPYTALPVSSVYSVRYKVPMVIKRKEAKDYGTKKMVEGITKTGVKCIVLEDIVTSGSSVIETAEVLRKEGLIVTDCVVILDRKQGAERNLNEAGIALHPLFSVYELFHEYCSLNNVEKSQVEAVCRYLETNTYIPIPVKNGNKRLPFLKRADACMQPVGKKLLKVIAEKESNLCLSCDVTKSSELLKCAEVLGPHICMLKTHIDIMEDVDKNVLVELRRLADEYNFLIMEDRKFADIGNTTMHQYRGGLYNIVSWADMVTVHAVPGKGILDALQKAAVEWKETSPDNQERGCVLIAQMSSKGALTDERYRKAVLEMAEACPEFVIGFVAQSFVHKKTSFLHMTPGVNISSTGDSLGQQYKSPEQAVDSGADVLIVGRGITESADMIEVAQQYKHRGYQAYLNKC